MPRIRTVKPEFWQDEKLAILDPLARLVFLGLISMADDAGRLVDNVKSIDGFIFPETEDTAKEALGTLARSSRICRYISASGQRLIQIRNWERHQKVDHPNKYVLPGPATEDLAAQTPTEDSRNPREINAKPSRESLATTNDQRSTTNDLVAGATNGNGAHPDPKPKRRPSRDPPAEPNWVAQSVEIHEQHIGQLTHGKAGKILKPLVDKYGWEAVKPVWEYFCEFAPLQDYAARVEGGTLREGEAPVKKFDYRTSPQSFVEHFTFWRGEAT